jgi:flagellar basal body-associated protein FliL
MYTVLVVCIIIVVIVLLLAALTTSKAYSYKHTVDPIENNPHLDQQNKETDKEE